MITLLALVLIAPAGATTTDTFSLGAAVTTAQASQALKLDLCQPAFDVTIESIEPYVQSDGGRAIEFVAYHWTGGTNWELILQGPRWEPAAGFDLSSSGPIGLALEAGELYALGWWIDALAAGYAYDEVGPQVFPWGTCEGSLFTGSGNDPVVPAALVQAPSAHAYRLDLVVSYPADADADGFSEETDCDELDPQRYPGAPERCNGLDDDCDHTVDEDIVDIAYYNDADGDGHGDPGTPPETSCNEPPAGHVLSSDDCNDADPSVYPGAPEQCNAADDDCDTLPDDGLFEYWYYADGDEDGFGEAGTLPIVDCEPTHAGYVWNDDDCDDGDSAVNPLAIEVCNGLDDECNGAVDDGIAEAPLTDWYPDGDGDGFGDRFATPTAACAPPAGMVTDATDCQDDDASRHPGAEELCNGKDDDCNAMIAGDENTDADGDGALDCADCDPADPTVFPAAPEVCGDGIDQDCTGVDAVECPEPPTDEGEEVPKDEDAGGGCSTSPAFGLLGLGLPLWVRRRRQTARTTA